MHDAGLANTAISNDNKFENVVMFFIRVVQGIHMFYVNKKI